jgi:hypothetical protein
MTKVFESIKKDFTFVKKGKKIYKPKFLDEKKTQVQSGKNVYKRFVKISLEERKRKVQDKIKIAKDQIKMLSGN